ncbi:MAG TPA: hypothetical protein VFE60_03880 [Roseiarcus sp.]|jgi:hypothetical protein|nr:hypothetical protein [Roseiarcus sp.]
MVDPAQQMIVGDTPLQAEAIEQRLLHHSPLAHDRPVSSPTEKGISAELSNQSGVIERYFREAVVRSVTVEVSVMVPRQAKAPLGS